MFKTTYEVEPYLLLNMSKSKRAVIAQFRAGILPLMIEVGRFRNIPVQNRICQLCNRSIEDEYHLVMECPFYVELRQVLYNNVTKIYNEFDNLDDIQI